MLVPVPVVDQLTPVTNDGQPSENAQADCEAAAVDAAARALGAPANLTPDWYKDSAYGQGYVGATAPMRYAPLLAQFGLTLSEFDTSDGAALISFVRQTLHAGYPVLGAIPSLWGNDYSGQDMAHFVGGTHAVTFCDDDGATLTAMNPWPEGGNAWYQKQPYAWWAQRIVYARVNPVRGRAVTTPYDGDFTIGANGDVYTLKSNPALVLSGGELELYKDVAGAIGLPLGSFNYGLQGELNTPHLGIREYERGFVAWDPGHVLDNPPQQDSGHQFYLCHVSDARVLALFGLQTTAPAPTPAPAEPAATPRQLAAEEILLGIVAFSEHYGGTA